MVWQLQFVAPHGVVYIDGFQNVIFTRINQSKQQEQNVNGRPEPTWAQAKQIFLVIISKIYYTMLPSLLDRSYKAN